MWNELFVAVLAVCLGVLLRWSFKSLPKEGWQILGCIPMAKDGSDRWKALNLTYYGLIVASAVVVATWLIFVLMGSIGVPTNITAVVLLLILPVWGYSTKFIAKVVEKKPHTLTIGGATFVGLFITPLAVWVTNIWVAPHMGTQIPMLPFLAAVAIAYTIGEGIGRLACISFGCCYGKPLSECGPMVRRIIGSHGFIFYGKTKKIAYEGGLDGQEVVPIQAITSLFHVMVSLVALLLYFNSAFFAALLFPMVTTQAWRAYSETLRADYRGGGTLSAYQIMAVIAVLYTVLLGTFLDSQAVQAPDVRIGLASMWHPAMIIALQAVGLGTFLSVGRSMVTQSTLSFHVLDNKV